MEQERNKTFYMRVIHQYQSTKDKYSESCKERELAAVKLLKKKEKINQNQELFTTDLQNKDPKEFWWTQISMKERRVIKLSIQFQTYQNPLNFSALIFFTRCKRKRESTRMRRSMVKLFSTATAQMKTSKMRKQQKKMKILIKQMKTKF